MEKQTKLADLKLVTKHFPVSNYSYPHGNRSQYQRDRPQRPVQDSSNGRPGKVPGQRTSSRESNSSVPSMVEDNGSDDDGVAEEELQYHVTGAQIWDSFWICQEKKDGAKDSKHRVLAKQPPHARPPHPQMQAHKQEQCRPSPTQAEIAAAETSTEWPLPANQTYQRPRTPKSPPKASYSLFPTPAPHKPSVLGASRPSRPGTPVAPNGNAVQLPSMPSSADVPAMPKQQRKPAPLNLAPASTMQLPITAQGPTPPSSVPASPVIAMPSPELEQQESTLAYAKPLSRRPSMANLRKISGSKTPKAAPIQSYLAMAQAHRSETHLPSTIQRQQNFDTPPVPPAPHSAPLPQSPSTLQRPSNSPEVGFPAEIKAKIPPMPPIPSNIAPRAPSPPRISFWLDSDSDSDEDPSDEESRSLARRILGGLSGHSREGKGHKRSASDGRSVGKAAPVRRPRADTTVEIAAERPVALVPDEEPKVKASEKEKEKEKEKERDNAERPRPRRQGSDVFGRMLGRRSR